MTCRYAKVKSAPLRGITGETPVAGLQVKAAEQFGITGERRKRLVAQPIAAAK
jgi:hypothetical protein